jgi:hypothetical protein
VGIAFLLSRAVPSLHFLLLCPLLALRLPLRCFALFLDLFLLPSALTWGALVFRLLLYPVEFLEAMYLFVAQLREPASLQAGAPRRFIHHYVGFSSLFQ